MQLLSNFSTLGIDLTEGSGLKLSTVPSDSVSGLDLNFALDCKVVIKKEDATSERNVISDVLLCESSPGEKFEKSCSYQNSADYLVDTYEDNYGTAEVDIEEQPLAKKRKHSVRKKGVKYKTKRRSFEDNVKVVDQESSESLVQDAKRVSDIIAPPKDPNEKPEEWSCNICSQSFDSRYTHFQVDSFLAEVHNLRVNCL